MLVNNMQAKMIVEDLFQNEDVVLPMNSYNKERMLPKQMYIECR
jgi:hypothetical protein